MEFWYAGPILESKGTCVWFSRKKTKKMFKNGKKCMSKYLQIFWKTAGGVLYKKKKKKKKTARKGP